MFLYQVRVGKMPEPQNGSNSLQGTAKTARKKSDNQRVSGM